MDRLPLYIHAVHLSFMLPPIMDPFFYLLGKAVFVVAAGVLAAALVGAALIAYSFKTGHFFMARIMLISVSLLESLIKSIFRTFRADDAIVDDVGVKLRNYINAEKFEAVPMDERAIFIPQCLRSVDCPAKLTPEGLRCVNCGRCEVGPAKIFAEDLGYRFFLAPGSSVIKRMIKKYRPRAIVGVGCPMEIKEGLELCQGHDIPAIGVPLLTNGCVSTTLDWGRFYEVISDRRAAAPPREEEAEIGIFSRM
ncbi:hypothetical protein Mhar_0151 [Methanothrix harundinacea 6Ac]|uniref:DUF116 domain-containing protein n=2 Tax=Methanothrix harundinacea TaxID=301375 RepID=G7WKR3_METH6|nr:hypothetical protein Mhar_0151 [Methanothrix harundinacea 6Ac]